MRPHEFIEKWKDNSLTERAGAQAYFIDLCDLLGVPKPSDPENYCFERGATRTGSGHGWADVWKRGFFAWENKGPHANLQRALQQLMMYALALDNPPLLVVCDRGIIQIHTHFTGTPSEVHTVLLEEFTQPEALQKLRWVFTDPERYRPRTTVFDITTFAAGKFADLAHGMTARGHDPQAIAHFLIQCLFCMFAEDVGLLPQRLFGRIVEKSAGDAAKLSDRLGDLFRQMQKGGEFLLEDIPWFNGGLFQTIAPIMLESKEVKVLLDASRMNWSQIEPSIFGTLFERGLNPVKRSQLGANFTDIDTIRKIVGPVVVAPLAAQWEAAKAAIASRMVLYHAGGRGSLIALREAQTAFHGFIENLGGFRVLDPACGSGNFLYLALRALKDLEHRANLEAEALGLHRQLTITCGPDNCRGLELDPYAAELARVTIWIGEIQWMLGHGYDVRRNPILSALEHVECRDALVNADGTQSEWPIVNAIVGNPPFLGNKKLLRALGDEYVARLRACYSGRVPDGVDLVAYWFEKSRAALVSGHASEAGLVATQGIRGGVNRRLIERIIAETPIFEAWSDEDWVNDGAAVRVSLICFSPTTRPARLDGTEVAEIKADLTSAAASTSDAHATNAARLRENGGIAFQGVKFVGDFAISGDLARQWLTLPANPNGLANRAVLTRWVNGMDLTRRMGDEWLIDFGVDRTEAQAALFEAPFQHLASTQRSGRSKNRESRAATRWWLHQRPRPEMRAALQGLSRYIATPEVSKFRIFVFLPTTVMPSGSVYAFAKEDYATFGVLHSRMHRVWALRMGTALEDRPRYTVTTTFETYPFPEGLTPNLQPSAYTNEHVDAIARAAQQLDQQRDRWLNPVEWTERQAEVVATLPERVTPKPEHAEDLARRTMTNLYNECPAWLTMSHESLDDAVAKAYGWSDYSSATSDEEILARLLSLNAVRAHP